MLRDERRHLSAELPRQSGQALWYAASSPLDTLRWRCGLAGHGGFRKDHRSRSSNRGRYRLQMSAYPQVTTARKLKSLARSSFGWFCFVLQKVMPDGDPGVWSLESAGEETLRRMSTADSVGPAERARRSKKTCLVWRGNGRAGEPRRFVCGRIGVCYVS